MSIGLVGVAVSFVLGSLLGGLSGYLGGRIDMVIQRVIEFLLAIPKIPLWMALAAALPPGWDPIKLYFGMTIILSLVGWTQIARVVRGKIISLREEDFVAAARIGGAPTSAILLRHLLPCFLSYLIVSLTLAVPQMILAETSLSFLGLGPAAARHKLGRAAAGRAGDPLHRPAAVAADPGPVRDRGGARLQLRRRRPARRLRPLFAVERPSAHSIDREMPCSAGSDVRRFVATGCPMPAR